MNVSLRQLHVFRAVAEERNFSRAGQQLGLTQPAVSRAIEEPSYPERQNSSTAASRAASRSKLRGRPATGKQ